MCFYDYHYSYLSWVTEGQQGSVLHALYPSLSGLKHNRTLLRRN